MGSTHTHVHPKWHGTIFGKTHVGPLFCPTFGTKLAHFQAFLDFGWANRGQNGRKMTSFHLFVHPKWSNIIFGKTRF